MPEVYDLLLERIISVKFADPIFNCQMGRGRTTTGMVICCLVRLIFGNGAVATLMEEKVGTPNFSTNAARTAILGYARGEFAIILQLLEVLNHGKLAKFLTDLAIDQCSHVQNLRECIFEYRSKLENLVPGTPKYVMIMETAWNYLIRYFHLISFADYLIETHSIPASKSSFTSWLEKRREIQYILRIGSRSLN